MMRPMLAREIMVTKLITLSPDLDVFEAIGMLLRHNISGAPVVDRDGNFQGVFSERCCMSVLVDAAYDQLPTTQVFAFMDIEHATISEEADLLSIAQIFLHTGHRRLPVVRDGKVVGQISRRDLLAAAMKLIECGPDREKALLSLSGLVERDQAPIS